MNARIILISLLGLALNSGLRAAAPAHSLTVGEGRVNPLGYHAAAPVFSWKLPEGVKKQSAYRLEISREGGAPWDSGWVESEQSVFVSPAVPPFASRQRVQWRVRFRDEQHRESDWSEFAQFELGLLSAADWRAKWIWPSQVRPLDSERVALLQRAFSVNRPVAVARLYVTARGLFELQLNGERVGRDHFANGLTSYAHRLDTLTYDVTKQLRPGDNAFEGLLGTGWYAGRYPFDRKSGPPYGGDPALLVQLEIHYADGSSATIVSDEQWQGTFDGPVVSSSLYDGENYDARRQPKHWAPVTAEADLGPAALTPKPFEPVRQTATLAVQLITEPQPGRFVFDLGQNMVGWARIKVPVVRDQPVMLRFAEMLQTDGTLYTQNYRTAKSTDTYISGVTGEIEWEPHFTFHGFRYVELSGLPAGARPEKNWVTGVVLHTDFPTTGRFVSSHDELNQLQSNITWGWHGNSLDIPTDCPQRDERAGWTGDAQVFCPTALFNSGSHAFWKSWLASMRADQDDDGVIPEIIPAAGTKTRAKSPGWMDAATFIPWELYVRTGDRSVLVENYTMMEKLVGWYRSQAVDGLLPATVGFGDWLQPYPQLQPTSADWMGNRRGDTPRPFLGAAFYARSAWILAQAAQVLGREEDAQRYADETARVRAKFFARYFDSDGKLREAPETQTAYALALAFDLVPAEAKPHLATHLVRLVGEADGHLRTGFLGTPYLVPVLDQAGHADLAYALLFQTTYPSWFFSIRQGATTLWERWNSYSHEQGFGDVRMNSFNHYAYGAVGQWLYERVAGLAPDPAQPGYKHFFIRPLPGSPLESARAELETSYGRAVSAWHREGAQVVFEIVVPPNTTATAILPGQSTPVMLAPGSHRLLGDWQGGKR